MLPLMDLNPNDLSCIKSMLVFVECQAEQLNMETAFITFDQLLWLKVVNIVLSDCMNVVSLRWLPCVNVKKRVQRGMFILGLNVQRRHGRICVRVRARF